MMSGLTVGFLSIDKLDLELKLCSGTPREKQAVLIIRIYNSIGLSNLPDLEKASLLVGDAAVI
jgi:hypothetical protein